MIGIKQKYGYKYEVIYHPKFREELVDVYIDYSNKQEIIVEKIDYYTKQLLEKGPVVLAEGATAFGKVKNSRRIFEIRLIKKNPNLRILFSFLDDYQIIFLTIFYEKNKSDYDKYTDIAKKRLKSFR